MRGPKMTSTIGFKVEVSLAKRVGGWIFWGGGKLSVEVCPRSTKLKKKEGKDCVTCLSQPEKL